jgi:hypothetical protein
LTASAVRLAPFADPLSALILVLFHAFVITRAQFSRRPQHRKSCKRLIRHRSAPLKSQPIFTGVADAAEQTGSAAVQVLSSSSELAEQAERLHQEMDKFLTTVRAA